MSQAKTSTKSLPSSGGSLDLDALPPISIIDAHMTEDERYNLAKGLYDHGAHLTENAKQAQIFIGKVQQPRRARLELRSRGLVTDPVPFNKPHEAATTLPQKRPRASSQGSETASESGDEIAASDEVSEEPLAQNQVIVIKSAWLSDSLTRSSRLPLSRYVVYKADVRPEEQSGPTNPSTILERVAEDNNGALTQPARPAYVSSSQKQDRRAPASFLHHSTSEQDFGFSSELPDPPEWVRRRLKYSCQRATPIRPPNDDFIKILKVIREGRELINDEIGVRAYSTSIAALAAYPHTLTSPREITALPGCSDKIAALFVEWKTNGAHPRAVTAVCELEDDSRLKVLRHFHSIWGVGPAKARELYERGWRDHDDIVQFGWDTLTRVQQLGLKYFDEFELKIPRSEIQNIERVVADHARQIFGAAGFNPDDARTCIVGGYRRGKDEGGDADIMVSHLDMQATQELVDKLVKALKKSKWITHTLITQLGGSHHGQAPKSFLPNGHHGRNLFDALDKSLVVWQDPRFHEEEHEKNPNPHRRVDIIVAPWPRIGCAVLGWTGATTFERDIRRLAEKERGWRFDSSGIRDRQTGAVVEVELQGGQCQTIEEAEKKVFGALGLDYLEPWERCTG